TLVAEREESLLLERRATVRRAAQIRLTELGRSAADFYRLRVEAPTPTPVAILGLGETGSRDDEARLVALLQHGDEAIRRPPLEAARWIVSDAPLVELASAALHDRSESVVRAAARLLRRRMTRIPRQVIEDACRSASRATRLAGLRLARRGDGWM